MVLIPNPVHCRSRLRKRPGQEAPHIQAIMSGAPYDPSEMFFQTPASYFREVGSYDGPGTAKALRRPLLFLYGMFENDQAEADFDTWSRALHARAGVTFKNIRSWMVRLRQVKARAALGKVALASPDASR